MRPTSLSASRINNTAIAAAMKTGQASSSSPMMSSSSAKKKRSSSIENPEPSSPKVTCIGTVRVMKSKHGNRKKSRTRSDQRRGEASFRRVDHNNNGGDLGFGQNHHHGVLQHQSSQECLPYRNHRWVHFPVTICEALKGFGSELNCLFPCRSFCVAKRDRGDRMVRSRSHCRGSCGVVFRRWCVAEQEVRRRNIEIETTVPVEERIESFGGGERRRHVFADLVFDDFELKERKTDDDEEVEEVGFKVVPPKNALLLMRCRYDPEKVASLANQVPIHEDEEQRDTVLQREDRDVVPEREDGKKQMFENEMECEEVNESLEDQETNSEELVEAEESRLKVVEDRAEDGIEVESETMQDDPEEDEELTASSNEEEQTLTCEASVIGNEEPNQGPRPSQERQSTENPGLPDCLLLMMCEPKLSMEVSKETWVCKTDFVRCLPERPPVNTDQTGDKLKKRSTDRDSKSSGRRSISTRPPINKALLQPPRSSCEFPAAPPLALAAATMIEQKLVGAKGYEPLVLQRCKSEPMRSSQARPEACFWTNRKLEPHREISTPGVGC